MSEQNKLNQQKNKKSFHLLLGTGIAFVMAGIVLLATLSVDIDIGFSSFRHLVLVAIGGILLFVSIVRVKKQYCMFFGLFLIMTGCLLFFTAVNYVPYTLESLWPFIVIFGSISLFISGIFVHRGKITSYIIPSVALLLLGLFFLLFSMNIIQEPFLQLASRWWPVVLIMAGLSLVILFFIWNKGNIQLEDADDDLEDLDDKN